MDHAGWRWIFLASLPVAATSLLLGLPLHEGRTAHGRVRLDPVGTLTLGAALCSVMVGLTFGPIWGWSSGRVVGLIVAGVALLVAFLVVETRVSAPLLDLDMFRRSRIVALGSAASLLNYTAMFGAIALTAVLLEVVGGHSPSADRPGDDGPAAGDGGAVAGRRPPVGHARIAGAGQRRAC